MTSAINPKNIFIENMPEISAIYYALLGCGYDFYAVEKPAGLVDKIKSFISKDRFSFFAAIKQKTCSVYPYWPIAAILETACFFLNSTDAEFTDFKAFKNKIMAAANISDIEKDSALWEWIKDFPLSLKQVMEDNDFQAYFEWEKDWVKKQNTNFAEELAIIQDYLNMCSKLYSSPAKRISIVLNPIKCAYSADYHLNGDCFVFCSGSFSPEAIIHEFLHHLVHNTVLSNSEAILRKRTEYPDIDPSYYLDDDQAGRLNAFEEYLVRSLTKSIISKKSPKCLDDYVEELLNKL